MIKTEFIFCVLIVLCFSCEKEKDSHRANVDKDTAYCRFEIKDYLFDFIEDTSLDRWQGTNRQGSDNIWASKYISSFGLVFSDAKNELVKSVEVYFTFVHDGYLLTRDYVFYGRNYFIEDSNFHNMFYIGEHNFRYKTPTSEDDGFKLGDHSVYIQLQLFDSIMFPSFGLTDNKSFSGWRSYKIINDVYMSNPNSFFEVTESEVINQSYNLNIYGVSRSRRIKGVFNCMFYYFNTETRLYDSVWIENAKWFGVIDE